MAENSKIQWTDATFNHVRGCTKVSEGCAHCYAETMSGRNPGTLGVWGPNGTRVVAAEAQWKLPARWNALAAAGKLPDGTPNADGRRPRVFCASLADVFEDWSGPMVDSHGTELCICQQCREWMYYTERECKCRNERLPRKLTMGDVRMRLFRLIDATPHLDWLLLTKRPENVAGMVDQWVGANPLPRNVWLGASVENQAAADARIPHLLATPAAVRFLSCEPLLGGVNLSPWIDPRLGVIGRDQKLDWVIVGCESGPQRRPMDAAWAASLVDQCRAADVACFVKQLDVKGRVCGEAEEFPQPLRLRTFPTAGGERSG